MLLLITSAASAQDAKLRASLITTGDLYVGQRATVAIDLLAPGYFADSPAFDLPDPAGMLLLLPTGSPTVGSETIDDVSYATQRHELSVIARHGGEQTIPAVTIRFHFKRSPLDKEIVAATVTTPPLTITTKVPPGAEKLGSIVTARGLTAVESWKPEPVKAKVGDAFVRTITFAAPDVPAMAFPPFRAAKIEGVGLYPKPPQVLDRSDRGSLHGERRDMITYVCQRPGRVVIPPVRLSWFDLESQAVKTIDFPARAIDVAPNPAIATAEPPAVVHPWRTGKWVARGLGWLIGLIAVGLVVRRYGRTWLLPFRPVRLEPLNPL